MTRQCLNRRMGDIECVRDELTAWEANRNSDCNKVQWHFTSEDARTKLLSLYPKFGNSGSKTLGYITININDTVH